MITTALDDQELEKLFTQWGCPLPFWEVKTTTLGSIAATQMVMPSHLIPLIWNGKEPVFESAEPAKEFFVILMGLWDRLARLQDGSPYPLWPVEWQDDTERIILCSQIRRAEIRGFLRGLDAGGTDSGEMTPPAADGLRLLRKADSLYQEDVEHITKDHTEPVVPGAADRLRKLDDIVQTCFTAILTGQRQLRSQMINHPAPPTATSSSHPAPTTGRNDPCPCGSGKKFKKCCGRQSNV